TLINTREGVKISRQPALIFCEQLGNEFCGRRWTRSHQILPGRLRLRSPGHDHASRPNANVTSVKVKDRSERKQSPKPRRLSKGDPSFGIAPSHAPIKTDQ